MKKNFKGKSGNTFIENNNIIWEIDDKLVHKIPIDGIKLIGEYTTSNGPFIDDWFLVIFDKNSKLYEVSLYAQNIQKVIDILSEKLETTILTTLFASAEWKSNILYPSNYNGKEIWKIVEVEPKSFADKIKSFIGFKSTKLKLTESSKEIIN